MGLLGEAEFGGGAAAGVEAPQVNGQLPGHGDDGFFALRTGGFGSAGKDGQVFFHGAIVGLEADQSPSQFDQSGSQARVAVFGDTALEAFVAAGILSRAESGVAADLCAVVESRPVHDFAVDHACGQFAQAFGKGGEGAGGVFDFYAGGDGFGEELDLFFQEFQKRACGFQVKEYPVWKLLFEGFPLSCAPPKSRAGQTLVDQQAAALGLEFGFLADELFTLAVELPSLFFLGRGDADDGEGVAVALQPAVEAQAEGLRIATIGFDSGVLFVEPLWSDDLAVDAPFPEFPTEAKPEAAGFVDDVDGVSVLEQAVDPRQKLFGSEVARCLGGGVVVLGNDDIFGGVDVQAKLDCAASRGGGGSRHRGGGFG